MGSIDLVPSRVVITYTERSRTCNSNKPLSTVRHAGLLPPHLPGLFAAAETSWIVSLLHAHTSGRPILVEAMSGIGVHSISFDLGAADILLL